jgi:predicted transcriptional regulator
MHFRVCNELVAEGLLRMDGHAVYSITDKGREFLIWGSRGY